MTVRDLSVAIVTSLCLCSCAGATLRQAFDPGTAAADAGRDIARGDIKFCYVGEFAYYEHGVPLKIPFPPGLPDYAHPDITRHYPRVFMAREDWQYAERYNARVWQYVRVKHRRS